MTKKILLALVCSASALTLTAARPVFAQDGAQDAGQIMIRNAGDTAPAMQQNNTPQPGMMTQPQAAPAEETAAPMMQQDAAPQPMMQQEEQQQPMMAAPRPPERPAPAPVLGTDSRLDRGFAPAGRAPVAVRSGEALSLRDAVAIGVRTNPQYGVVSANRRATDEELRQAKALYLPSIDLRADTGVEHSDDPATRAGLDDDPENLWRYEAGLTLTQLLFDGWETKYENKRQKFRVESASRRVKETSELVGLAVVEGYLEVLRQRELLRIARDNVADHISLMSQISDSSGVGRTTIADVEQARARLASARAQEASVREALRFAEASFIRAVGQAPGDLIMPMVPADALSADVEQEVKIALHQSPTIEIFESDIKVANAEYEGTKSTFYPQLDFQVNAREGQDLGGVRGRDTSASALVVMNWNLYRGGGDTARVREHINREAQAKEARAEAARGIENDVRQTWARMVSAGERARQFAAQADANAEVVKAYRDQFNLDRRTLLDVLDSQNEYFVSRSSTVNAEFLEMFAVFRLLALKGQLLPVMSVEYPRESDPAKM